MEEAAKGEKSSYLGGYKRWALLILLAGYLCTFLTSPTLDSEGKAESTPVSEEQKSHPLSAVVPTPLRDEEDESKREKLLVVTVSTIDSYAFRRFYCSASAVGLPVHVLGMGDDFRGLGEKVLRLRSALEYYKDDTETVILFADAFDVLFYGGAKEILERFKKFDARVVFSTEHNCWPDAALCEWYPPNETGKKFLNAGLFIGYASELYKIVNHFPLTSKGDDQGYYTKVYVNEELRREWNIKLDHNAELFQTFEGGGNFIQIHMQGTRPSLKNLGYQSEPLLVHTPGNCKFLFLMLANYIPKMWDDIGVCSSASLEDWEFLSKVSQTKVKNGVEYFNNTLELLMTITIKKNAESVDKLLNNLYNLEYPKNITHIIIHSHTKDYAKAVKGFFKEHSAEYGAVRVVLHQENFLLAHNDSKLEECIDTTCLYRFDFDATYRLDNPKLLRFLMEQNRTYMAPMFFGEHREGPHFFGLRYRRITCTNTVEIFGDQYRAIVGHF